MAPVSRASIVLGQALGSTTLALLEGMLFLILAPFAGVSLTPQIVVTVIAVMFLIAFGLTNLGLMIAWQMQSTQGFHAIMNLILLPIWVLSGAIFPVTGAPWWMAWAITLNPLTYGMALLRRAFYLGNQATAGELPSTSLALGITLGFCFAAFAAAIIAARRSSA